jgi:hypothetical protein
MAAVTRLLTFVDIDDAEDEGPDARKIYVSVRQEAVLADGRRVVLLDDRGWSGTLGVSPGIWAFQTVEEIERTARFVVGPDEPFEGHTQADMEESHWEALARTVHGRGVEIEARELKALPHDVELSDRVLARLGRGRRGAPLNEQ